MKANKSVLDEDIAKYLDTEHNVKRDVLYICEILQNGIESGNNTLFRKIPKTMMCWYFCASK